MTGISVLCIVFLAVLSVQVVFAASLPEQIVIDHGYDRPGMDYKKISLGASANWQECLNQCKQDPNCRAFSVGGKVNPVTKKLVLGECYLKNGIPAKNPDGGYISGFKQAKPENTARKEQTKVAAQTLVPSISSVKVYPKSTKNEFDGGMTAQIEWYYSNLSGTVRILLYRGGAPVYSFPLVSVSLDNTGYGHFDWTIDAALPSGNDYTIVVQSNDKPNVRGVSSPLSLWNPKDKVKRPCPPTINVTKVPLNASNVQNVPPGFIASGFQLKTVKLYFEWIGRDSPTKCYCAYAMLPYTTGSENIEVRLYADMTGYVHCSEDVTQGVNPLIYNIALYKK